MHSLSDVPVLQAGQAGRRVTLRAHHRGDVTGIVEQCQDPLSQQWTTVPVPYDASLATAYLDQIVTQGWRQDTEWTFAVEASDEGGLSRFAGSVSLRLVGEGRAEIAFGAHPWARGHGIMILALRRLLEYGFSERGLRTVSWWAFAGNWPSRRLAWQLGFSSAGEVPGWLPQRGHLRDSWVGTVTAQTLGRPRGRWITSGLLSDGAVTLRSLRPSDVPAIQAAVKDAQIARWLGQIPQPFHAEDGVSFVRSCAEQAASGSAIHWAITLQSGIDATRASTARSTLATDELAGVMSLFGLGPGADPECGYWVSPRARHQGVATAAARLALGFGFAPVAAQGLGLTKIKALVAVGNEGSRRVVTSVGLQYQGIERARVIVADGLRADAERYDLLAEEWAATT